MGKQINYYMEYESFSGIARKALELGCEIIRDEHADEIARGYSADIVIPQCIRYFFRVPQEGIDITYGEDVNGKKYVRSGFSAAGNTLIEASYSYIRTDKKKISRGRLYCTTGYYENGEFIYRPECVTKIYEALVRCAKKAAPYRELVDVRTDTRGDDGPVQKEYKHKEYISDHCLKLKNEGYEVQ